LGDPDVNGKLILRWTFREWDTRVWTRSNWFRIGTGGGHCECGNGPSGSIKCGEFLDWLRAGWLLKKRLCCMK